MKTSDIIGYIPHKLKGKYSDSDKIVSFGLSFFSGGDGAYYSIACEDEKSNDFLRPILYPFSILFEYDERYEDSYLICSLLKKIYHTTQVFYVYPDKWEVICVLSGGRTRTIRYEKDKLEFSALEIDFFHENKIDYRGLIVMGSAIDVNNLNINPYRG